MACADKRWYNGILGAAYVGCTTSDQGDGSIHLGCIEAARHDAENGSTFDGFLDCRGDPTNISPNFTERNYRQIMMKRYTRLRVVKKRNSTVLEPAYKGDVFSDRA